MSAGAQIVPVSLDGHRLHVEVTPGPGAPLVLLHGFPDNVHLYDLLLPYLSGRRALVRFDFLGWGSSDKPEGYAHTAANQIVQVDTVIRAVQSRLGVDRVVPVAHDASGPPAIDWALNHPGEIEGLVLLNTYYHRMRGLHRPQAITLYSTPVLRVAARAVARLWPELDHRLYRWQVGKFIHDDAVRERVVTRLYEQFRPARPAFWQLNNDLIPTLLDRRRRVGELRRYPRPVRVVFGALDPYLNSGVARQFAGLFPNCELHLLGNAGHYVQVDEPALVADLITAEFRDGM